MLLSIFLEKIQVMKPFWACVLLFDCGLRPFPDRLQVCRLITVAGLSRRFRTCLPSFERLGPSHGAITEKG